MVPRLPPVLLALTPGTLVEGRAGVGAAGALERAVRAAAGAGLEGLLLREPRLEDGALLELGRRLRVAFPGWLGLHDRVHLAAAVGADGVHLGGRSLPPRAALEVLAAAPRPCLGVSTHRGDPCPGPGGADYALHGPYAAPRSKPAGPSAPLGEAGLAQATRAYGVPVLAVGGIGAGDMDALARAGARGAAVIGSLWGTGPAPLDGALRAPLDDAVAIASRAEALVRAARAAFGGGGG